MKLQMLMSMLIYIDAHEYVDVHVQVEVDVAADVE